MPSRRAGWLTNRVANPVLLPLLRGPLGPQLGRWLAVIRYQGRRTGRTYDLVVQYVRDGDRLWVVPGHPDRKLWWRNLVEPAPVELWLAGEHDRGTAVAIRAPHGLLADAATAYRRAFPRARGVADAGVMVRIDLEREAGAGPDGEQVAELDG